MKVVRMLGSIAAVAFLVGVATPAGTQAADCGPGPDWVDSCPSGTDRLHSVKFGGTIIFDPEDSPDPTNPIVFELPPLRGKVKIFRGPGAPGSDFGGDSHILTEMVFLNLQGGGLTLTAGDGIGNLQDDGPRSSPGRIDENADNLTAHSFFDVFFELSPTPFGPLHNDDPGQPCVMATNVLDQVGPPIGFQYFGCGGPPGQTIDLFDANGVHRAALRGDVIHEIVVPEPATLLLVGSGLVVLGGMARRGRRK